MGVSAGCQAVPCWSANRRLIKAVLETDAPGSQPIQIRCMRERIPKAAKRIKSVVVTHKDKNIHSKFLLKIIFIFYKLQQEFCHTPGSEE